MKTLSGKILAGSNRRSAKQALSHLMLTALILLAPHAYAQAVSFDIIAKDGDAATGTIGQFNLDSFGLQIDNNGTVFFHAFSSATDPFGTPISGLWTASNGAPTPFAIVGQTFSGYSLTPLSTVSNRFFTTPGGRIITYVDNFAWMAGTASSNLAPILTFSQIPPGLPSPSPGQASEGMFMIGLLAGSKAFGQPNGGLTDFSAAYIGNPAPSIPGTTITGIPELGNFDHNPTIANDSSDVLFQADISDLSLALYLDSAAVGIPTKLLAHTGSATPGIPHGKFLKEAWPKASFYPVMNGSQQGMFVGKWKDPLGPGNAVRNAIWRFDANATPVIIASVWRDPAKDPVFITSEGPRTGFSRLLPQFSNPVIAPNGDGYFTATGQQVNASNTGFVLEKTSGLWRAPAGGGNLELLFRTFNASGAGTAGTILPDGSEITNILDFGMSPEGQLIIKVATFKAVEGNKTKLFAQDSTGGLHYILGSGDIIQLAPGVNKTISQFGVSTHSGLSGTAAGFRGGKIAIRVYFLDNSVAILRTSALQPTNGSSANCDLCSGIGEPINTFSGELYEPLPPDINLGGPMPLRFERYYAAFLRRSFIVGDLGSNWRHNFDARLFISGNTAKYVSWKGRVTDFVKNLISGVWEQQTNLDTTYKLTKPAGQNAALFDPQDNLVYTFDFTTNNVIMGKLATVEDGKGNVHTVTYNLVSGQIQSVSDGLGRTLTFTYNADAIPKIVIVSDGTRAVNFGYTDPIDTEYLTLYTDVRGGVTTYAYKDTSANADHALMTQWTLPRGNIPFLQTFDAQGRVLTQTDASGNATTLAYGVPSAGLTTLTDPMGVTRIHSAETSGAFNGMQDQAGQTFSLSTDASGRRNSLTDRLGDTTSMAYHAASGKLSSISNADATTESFAYTPRALSGLTLHDMSGATNADGTTISMVHDAFGNLTSRTDQLGNTATFTYNGLGQVLSATNMLLGVSTNTYNADGTLASSMDPATNSTLFGYDLLKRPVLTTYADGSTTSFTYDNADNLLTTTDENGNVTTMTYDANGNLATSQDALFNTTTFAYDGNDRLVSTTDALGSVTSRTYHPLGEVGTTTDANGNTTSMGYNTLGRLTSITDPLGNIWSRTYDTEGIITSRSDPLGNTTNFVSDKMGRITQTTSPLGFVSTVSYDAMGRVATTTDPLNQITTFSRDARGQVTAISLPGGTISSTITRNALGEPTSIVDPNGNAWNRSYDTSGRLVSSTDPLGQAKTTTYDNRNRPSVVTFPGALGTQTLGYDAAGNVISINYSDGTVFNFSYDARNDLISANNGGVTPNNVSRSYDANGRISNSNGTAITRDVGGRITGMTLAAGKNVTYAYDANDHLATVTDWAGGITTFTYDNAGRLTGMTRPNGVNQTNAWDNDSRLTGIIEGAISSISLTRDANGQITAATRNVPQAASSATLTGSTQTFDAASQVVGNTYDVLGRRTAAGADTFNWDHASRLTAYTVGGTTAANVYDSLGRRISRTVGANTVDYVWNDGLGLPSISVEQRNATDFRYFVHTPAGDLLYSVDAATGSRNFYHFDEMGNTIFITDDAGTVIGSYAYTPFGQLIASTVALDNPFTWQGKHGIMDEGNGLYYVRARYYDANSGRFISRDAKKSIAPMTVNPYQYALNNPLSFLDVNGLDPQTIKKLIQGSIERAKKRSEGLDRETADLIGKLIQKDLRLGADEIYGESRVEDSILPLFLDYMLIPRGSELLLVLFDGPGVPIAEEISMLREKLKRIRQRNRELLSKNKRAAILLHAKKQLDKARKEAYEGGTRTRATQDALDKKVQDAEKAFSDAGGIESVAPELTPIVVLD